MSRRALRRYLRRTLTVVAVGILAAVSALAADAWLEPEQRIALIALPLLGAFLLGAAQPVHRP